MKRNFSADNLATLSKRTMATLKLSAELALLAGLCSVLQALAVECELTSGDFAADRSPSLTATVISIVISVAVFWVLLATRGVSLAGIPLFEVLPFVAGLGNPAPSRLLYIRSFDRIGARILAAVVSANLAIATVLALIRFGEVFTHGARADLYHRQGSHSPFD